jgi:sec-independent protein translocase protein TatA
MFGISGEHLLVLLVVLLFFGPRRLPELGNSLGRTLKNFKDAMNGNDKSSEEQSTKETPQALPKQTQATAAKTEEAAVHAESERNKT